MLFGTFCLLALLRSDTTSRSGKMASFQWAGSPRLNEQKEACILYTEKIVKRFSNEGFF